MSSADLEPLEEQTVVITGATSGIGLTTARMAADRGARVVAAARSEDALAELVEEIEEQGGGATSVVADVRDREDVREVVETAETTYGGFDTWVNCAAAFLYGTLEETPVEDMREQFETNVWGVVYGSLEAATALREHDRGGAIVNLGSVLSDRAVPLQGSTAASKHAVEAFTDALRVELDREDAPISVTLLKPSAVDTPRIEHARNYMDEAARQPSTVYAPEVVARAILHAAEHPHRELVVGGRGRAVIGLDRVSTGLADRVLGSTIYGARRSDRIATRRGSDALAEPVGDLEERSDRHPRVRERSYYARAQLGGGTSRALALAGLGTGLAYLAYRARRGERPTGEVVGDVARRAAESVPEDAVERAAERVPEPVVERAVETVPPAVVERAAESLPDEVAEELLGPGHARPGQLFPDVEPADWPWVRGTNRRERARGETTRTGSATGRVARAVTGLVGSLR